MSLIVIFILSFLITPHANASWAYPFVVWKGYVYVVTEEQVYEIDKKIGHVTNHTDREGTYWGNFSNAYEIGTKYYSIVGISTNEAIAVQTQDDTFLKAIREGKYKREWPLPAVMACIIVLIVLILGFVIFRKKKGELNL